jgi:NAD(P)-dependent dehydrogenase (short-subunit alcohol dehydrogenase family)
LRVGVKAVFRQIAPPDAFLAAGTLGVLQHRHGLSRQALLPLRARAMGLDITDEAALATAFREVAETFGSVDCLVNSAGIGRDIPFAETAGEDFRRVLDVNVVGAFPVSRGAVRHTTKGAGTIVHASSVDGIRGVAAGSPMARRKGRSMP